LLLGKTAASAEGKRKEDQNGKSDRPGSFHLMVSSRSNVAGVNGFCVADLGGAKSFSHE
jgi:hypothetical protein